MRHTADVTGLTFHYLSWVHVRCDGEDDAPATLVGDAPAAVYGGDDGGLGVKCRYLPMAIKRSLVICSAMGR